MDIFRQNRYLLFFVILLIIFNLGTLAMLWIGRQSPPPLRRENRDGEEAHIRQVLQEELNFDERQTQEYLQLRRQYRDKVRDLNEDIQRLKQQMFDDVLQNSPQPVLSDSLLLLTQEKQTEIERITFQYFLDLKNLCRPEQQQKLQVLIHDFFRQKPPRDSSPPPSERPAPVRPQH